MNPFLESPDTRIRIWRDFRKSLTADLSDLEQLKIVVNFFSQTPESSIVIDIDNPKSWLTPWEIFYSGDFCQNTIAYLIEQTLLYSECKRWTTDRVKLKLIKDVENTYLKLMVLVDNKYVLNHEYNKIVNWENIKNNCSIICSYDFNPLNKLHIIK